MITELRHFWRVILFPALSAAVLGVVPWWVVETVWPGTVAGWTSTPWVLGVVAGSLAVGLGGVWALSRVRAAR